MTLVERNHGACHSYRIREMELADVGAAVRVHLEGFTGFFLSFLGPAFLHELYAATIEDRDGIGLVAEEGKEILGFVTGTAQPAGFYRRLLRQRWWRFGLACVIPTIKRPIIIPRLIRAFAMPGKTANKNETATLMSIAVRPDVQGKGIGKALVLAFLGEAGQRGVRKVDLATDSDNNDKINHFYLRLGFSCEKTFVTPEGRAMNEYVIDLPNSNGYCSHPI